MGVAPIKDKGKLHSDPVIKASLLNDQFKSVFVKDGTDCAVPVLGGEPFQSIKDLSITVKGVEIQLLRLADKAPGPDQLPNFYLRERLYSRLLC